MNANRWKPLKVLIFNINHLKFLLFQLWVPHLHGDTNSFRNEVSRELRISTSRFSGKVSDSFLL